MQPHGNTSGGALTHLASESTMELPRAYAASPLWLTIAMKMWRELLRGGGGR